MTSLHSFIIINVIMRHWSESKTDEFQRRRQKTKQNDREQEQKKLI